MAGYFCYGRPSVAITRLFHDGTTLTGLPETRINTPFRGIAMSGSEEIRRRYFNQHEDKHFVKYFRPSGPCTV
jgi:hypothetical protein